MVFEVTRLWLHLMAYSKKEANILFRKDQVDTKDNKRDIKMLKDELWTRRVSTKAKVIVLRENQVVEKITSLDEIRRNKTRKQEVWKKLKKDNEQSWEDNRIVYIEGEIYVPNNWKIQEQILQENYEPADVRYLGQQRVLKLIKRN